MHVAQLTPQAIRTGGISTFVRGLADEVAARGDRSTVLAPDTGAPEGSAPGEASRGAFDVVTAPGIWPTRARGRADEDLVEQIRRLEADVVLVHHLRSGPLLDRLAEEGRPVAEFVHGFACSGSKLFRRGDTLCSHPVSPRCLWDHYAGPCGGSPNPRVALADHRQATNYLSALRRLPRVFVASRFMRDYLVGEGVAPDRIGVHTWAPPVDGASCVPGPGAVGVGGPGALAGMSGDEGKGPVPGRLLVAARLGYPKGVQYLLRALGRLPEEFHLHAAGDGWYRSALEDLVHRLGLDGRVTFLGDLAASELDREYRAASVVVVPSIWPEPLGLVVAEAARRGRPVVASAVGGLPEWAGAGAGVELCPPADPAALADAVLRTARSGGSSGDLGAAVAAGEGGRSPLRALLDELCGLVQPSAGADTSPGVSVAREAG